MIKLLYKKWFSSKFFLSLTALAFLVIPLACSSFYNAEKKHAEDPILSIDYWGTGWQSKPLAERVSPTPPGLIKYLRVENKLYGFDERPVAVEPYDVYKTVFKSIVSELPQNVRNLLEKNFLGLFMVTDLGSSGFTEAVADDTGNLKYAFIVLDRDVMMKRKANEWATWKENSVFKSDGINKIKLSVKIETDENNTVENAIRFILLHELGHALGLMSRAHPPWPPSRGPEKLGYPFTSFSWEIDENLNITSIFDDKFPERKSLMYYSFENAKLTNSQIVDIYNKLIRHTNFVSMPSTPTMWEDFAECFVIYFHTIIENRPWEVCIEQEGRPPIIINSCWEGKRCNDKKAFMESWFKKPL